MPPKIILKISIIVFCTSASFFFIRNVSAQSPTKVLKKITNAPIENYKPQAANTSEITCEALTKRFTTRMEKFEKMTTGTDESYKKLRTKLYERLKELKASGGNVSKIESSFAEVDKKITDISNKRKTLTKLSTNLQKYLCQGSKTDFSKALKEATDAAKALHVDSIALQKLFQTEIRAEMYKLQTNPKQ